MSNEMFSMDSPSLRSTIREYRVEFPRYQRNKAWDETDKFKLFISVFKSYPIGSIVVKELVDGEKLWMLDGRQRYETIRDMQNPETVYLWAKKFCGFKDSDDVKEKLKEKISEYLGYDINGSESWFNDLSDVVSIVHPFKKRRNSSAMRSGFRTPFIYEKFKPSYVVDLGNGVYDVDSDKLLKWILGSELTKSKDIEKLTAEDIMGEYDVREEDKPILLKEIENNLEGIKKSLKAVKIIQTAMLKNQLSLIILDKSCKSSDEMKIFEIVNTGGRKLNNAQIRSAKKQWNYEISDVVDGDPIYNFRKKLYEAQELTLSEVCVSWDFAATFVDRLNENSDVILSKNYRTLAYDHDKSKDKMEFGFKLLSARFKKDVTKEAIDELPGDGPASFKWSLECKKYAAEINEISDFLVKNDRVFEHFKDYGFSLFNIGQNIAICFLILAIDRWHHYGMPVSGSKGNKYRGFILDIRRLLDTFIYDYVSDKWKGSGDSLLRQKLKDGYVIEDVSKDDWNDLIDRLYTDNEMEVGKNTESKLKVLTYYFTAIRNKTINGNGELVQVDHIIPKSQFMDNTPAEFKKFKDSLVNYALLPSRLNKDKSDWITRLPEPDIEEVCLLEDLNKDELESISAAAGISNLKIMRKDVFEQVKDKRNSYVTDSGFWKIQ